MGYWLGVDLGTTYSAAAIAREGRTEVVNLGTRAAAIPSVVVVRPQGEVLVGEAAERRAFSEPARTAREFKRRLGDPTPMLLGGTPYGAEALMAYLLRHIVEQVETQEGGAPDGIVLSHPANYGPYKKDLLLEIVRQADVGTVSFVTEPEAAAIHYTARERIEPGEVVAVYDFGGGTFDAAVLRRTADGFELLGTPEGLDRLGGIDFDHAVYGHVNASLGGVLQELDAVTINLRAVSRLRDDCRTAKEALSSDTDATVSVMLPNAQTEVRLTRDEFEATIRPRIAETVASLERAIRSAGLKNDDVARVLLVGGSSRIPLVGQMVREATSRPVTVDADPKFSIALGAALAGEQRAATALPETPVTEHEAQVPPAPPPLPAAEPAAGGEPTEMVIAAPEAPGPPPAPPEPAEPAAAEPTPMIVGAEPAPAPPPPPAGATPVTAADLTPSETPAASPPHRPPPPAGPTPPRRRPPVGLLVGIGAALVVVVLIAAFLLTRGGGGGGGGGQVALFDLRAGDCGDTVDGEAEIVDCDSRHDFEVYAVIEHPDAGDDDFPGRDDVDDFANEECGDAFRDFVGVDAGDSDLKVQFLRPRNQGDWDIPEREVTCTLTRRDGDQLDESAEDSRE